MDTYHDKFGFKLEKITTEQFAIIEDSYEDDNDSFELEANLIFGINKKNFAVLSKIKFQFKQKDKPFIIIEASCQFSIAKKIWNELSNEKTIQFPKEFFQNLATITVGTTRGILHSKIENTKFNKTILPTISIDNMVTDDYEFNI